MKRSPVLLKQHIGWHFKKYWAVQGARKVINTKADEFLKGRGVSLDTFEDFLKVKHEFTPLEVIGKRPKPVVFDKTHPNWHDEILLTYKDHNVLLEGLAQAKILTNTVEIKQGLPFDVSLMKTKKIDSRVKDIIKTSFIFDAEQKKLPKIKDPERPAWNFPRIYGITEDKTIKLLLSNLLQTIELNAYANTARNRSLLHNLFFSYYFNYFKSLLSFQLRGDAVLTSSKPLSPVTNDATESVSLPDISPIKPTITLNRENIYETRNIYPINLNLTKCHPHTIFISRIQTEVKNLYEEEVTENQLYGRSLLKAFTVAASYAVQKYGEVKNIPAPVTVQCVQTNGHLFHFGIFQLNTLDLENQDVKNVWYQTDHIPLFEECTYKLGKPTLNGYNNEVVKHLMAFYNRE